MISWALHPIPSRTPGVAAVTLRVHMDACLRDLLERGYSPRTVGYYRSSFTHFAHWLTKTRIAWREVDEALVQRFLVAHLPTCHCRYQRSKQSLLAALGHLVRFLRTHGQVAAKATDPVTVEIQRYDTYLDKTCGLAFKTRQVRASLIRPFLAERLARGFVDLGGCKAQEIHRHVIRTTQGWTRGSAAVLCGALRSYLRFCAFQGESTEALQAAVPTVAQWSGESLPKALAKEEIDRFLGAFDGKSVVGCRNYAIARCLVDLGLRVGEVAALQLEDIDWRAGTLRLQRTKGGRQDLLPLPVATGDAIVAYLKQRTAARTQRALFVRQQAPLDQPLTANIVSYAMRQAYARAAISPPWTGSHRFRHSLACSLVNTGTPLKEIADVLRHRNLNTTMIYARADLAHLAQVAMPWPGRAS